VICVAWHQRIDLPCEHSAQKVRRLLQSTSAALLKRAERHLALVLCIFKRSDPDSRYKKTRRG
jgi:hypothetical protein